MNNCTTKQCSKCKKFLPQTKEYFHAHKSSKDGLRSQCKECRKSEEPESRKRERNKKWKEKNKDYIKMYRREYYQENKETEDMQTLEYYKSHRSKINNRRNELRHKDIEKTRNYSRTYYKKNAEQLRTRKKQWRIENPGKQKIIDTRSWIKRKSLLANLPNDFTHEQWMECLKFFNERCAYCEEDKPLAQDHFVPLTKGGEYTKNNIIPACKNCNSRKHNRDFFIWYPQDEYYNKKREDKILKYLGYKNRVQQLSIL